MEEREITNRKYEGITFIGGVHGVGKSTFAHELSEQLGIPCYSCSKLIEDKKNKQFSQSKAVENITGNQVDLADALTPIKAEHSSFLLDGHFCLLLSGARVTQIPRETFVNVAPQRIIVLSAPAELIKKRRPEIALTLDEIRAFQETEIAYARSIAAELHVDFTLYSYEETSQQFRII